ncbi:AlkA N-terminal domain-containing protein [Fodinicola feengrottensis]|uniref:AlkA N-terminal domain-containing protein n=1 Tax=Fodinicola feengrottensis TaxID=435914 RepID=UPI0028BD4C25|nr:AlkA N-terminal domain-containing protein [Fodinicola feengrottensis]
MRLPFQPPYDWDNVQVFLAERAIPGVESVQDGVYRRTISLDGGPGVLEVRPGNESCLLLQAHLPYWEGLIHVVERAGRMVGLADPTTGPGAWGAFEIAAHAIVAQHCGLARARTRMGTLTRHLGQPVGGLTHGLTHLFPSVADLVAGADLTAVDLPRRTAQTLRSLATAVAAGTVVLDCALPLPDLVRTLTAVSGLGVPAAHHIATRLGHHLP